MNPTTMTTTTTMAFWTTLYPHRRASLRGLLMILVAALGLALGGCASDGDREARAQARAEQQRLAAEASDPFAAGADRKPTADTMFALARLLIVQGKDADAMFVLSRAIQQYPGFLPAYNEMAGIYARSDRLNDAREVLTAGLEQSPDDPVLHNNLGMLAFLQRDFERALDHFSTAAYVAPANPIYRGNQAAALGMLGRDAEAMQVYERVVSRSDAVRNLALLTEARETGALMAPPAVEGAAGAANAGAPDEEQEQQ